MGPSGNCFVIRQNGRENINGFNQPQPSLVNKINGPFLRSNTQESFYVLFPNYVTPIFEGGQGYQNGNFQDPMLVGRNRKMNNPVFKPDPIGVGG